MNVIDMYKKITSSILMLLVIVRPEEISVNNVTQANLLSLRLSTIVPYLSLHNDQNFTKDNAKRSLFLIMPPSQTRDEYKKPKEIVQKIKRCGKLPRKNKFLSSSRKEENTIRAEMKTGSLNRNIKIPRQNSNACTLSKNVKYLQEIPANKMKVETYKDNTFLRALKNNMNAENIILNLESPETKKKCNTENCICYCKEENCFSKSSMKNSSEILSSSRKDKLEKINHQREKDENTKSNVLHQSSPKLYHKSPQELRVPNLINSFPTFYQERIHPMNIPRTPILYEKTPNILPYIIRNEKKFDNIPFPSLENRPNFLLKSNAYKPYQSTFHRNLQPCPRTIEENRVGSPISTTSSSTSYIGATIRQQTENDLESIGITGKDENQFFQLNTETPNNFVSINSEMETNFYPSYLDNKTEESSIIDFSNLNGIICKLKNSTEKTKGNQEDDFSKLMPSFTNYVDRSRTPSIIYPSIMQNEKFINMEECIQLFGRDVCVLSATSPEILAKQIPENNINEYSTIRIPEYIMQMSTKEITTNNVDYLDKFKTTDTYAESKSSTSGIKTSNVDLNEYLESTNTELNTDANEKLPQEFYRYEESITQTYEPNNDNYADKLFNSKEDTHIPMKKLMDQTTDKTMEIARNTLLGKSKSHVKPLLNSNYKEALNPSSSEKYLYTNSYEYNNDQELNNLKTDQQTLATLADININSWSTLGVSWNTLRKEESTTIMYDLKTEYNFEEENKNYLKESNINYYPDDEISQEQFEEEDTTINYNNLKTKHNFKEEITNKLNESKINTSHEKEILEEQSEEISTISYDSKAIYNSEEENMYDLERLNISFNPEKEILQEQFEEKIIPISSDFNTEYSFEETTENDLLGETVLGNEILQKQPITQYLNHEKTNYLNNKEDITNRSETTIDSSSKILPYCDNTLLLNSIRKVMDDFHTLNISLTETKDLDKNVLQIQDRSLLPEILQIPNLQSMSILQTENTIVEKMKDDLTDITAIPRRNPEDFTSDRSPDVIKNSFHSISQTLSTSFHQKLPSITIEEHQFKNEQWTISPITLASVPDSKLSIANPVNLEKSRNPLNSSTIASQTDQYIRNMIVQSTKNSLTKDEHKDINNSIIHVLNNTLQILKDSEDTNMLKKNDRFVGSTNVNLTLPQEISANNYEERINIDNSTNKLNVHIPKNTKIDIEKMQMMISQEPKALENNASMIVSNFSDSTENEKDKSTDIEEKTPKEIISKTEENVGNQRIQKIDTQDNEEKELAESLKTTYHKVISQNNLNISAIPVESNFMEAGELNKKDKNIFLETTTISPIITKNFDETEKDIITLTPRIKDASVNNDDNKPSTNDYSLNNQVLKYIQNYRINEENIQITTMPTNFIEKTSSNYNVQISNDTISENVREVKNRTEYILNREISTELPNNIISSTDKYRNEKSKIASSTDEINPEIILERIEHNLSPIKYYSPEILKYIKNQHNADAFISFKQETLPDHAQMSDSIISQNITSAKNVGDKIESILNEKTSTISTDNVISSLNIDYGNYESNITPSTDNNVLDSQQQDFMTKDNIIAKIHETTTEVQQTYAKTTYFKVKSSPDKPRINLSSSAYKADENNNNDNKDKNSSNDNDNLIGKMYNDDIITETNNVTTHISALEKSQLYYISDNMKLPLEIRKLEDGSYVLSITKNVCEQRKILERKCSCCVPLQEHVTLSWNQNQDQSQGDMYGNKRDYYLTELPNMLTMTTGNNILKMQKLGEEKGRISAHYHCTQNLNDNNLITILMPIIDCTKNYNLFLDFNKVKKMPFSETEPYDIIQNYDKLLIEPIKKFEYDKLEKQNFNNNFEIKENEFASKSKDADELQNSVNFRERKDTMSTNFSKSSRDFYDLENSIESESQNKNIKADQREIIKDLHKFETEKNIQNTNIERIINSKSQKRNPLFRSIDISKEDTKINNEEVKSNKHRIVNIEKGNVKVLEKKKERKPQQIIEYENQERIPSLRIINSGDNVNMESEETSRDKLTNNEKGNVFYKKEKKEHKIRMIDNKQNDSRIKIFEGDNKKPYRYQRNTSGILNKRAELTKSVLYWLKSLFSNK